MRIAVIIIKILFIGSLLIVANLNLQINQESDREILYGHVYDWLDSIYQRSLGFAGYVVKSEWLPSTPTSQGEDTQEKE